MQDGQEWKKRVRTCGHVTGQNSDSEDSKSCTGGKDNLPRSSDLAKPNSKCISTRDKHNNVIPGIPSGSHLLSPSSSVYKLAVV